ncbi:MAG TPA: DUF6468 domain-containing protein [Aliidongia sp.]|uniref:DUF6468 domain-containing protein n=1 Tax=Aliidongia sp. TaxID=1914230 RepID=UPI002DDCAE65|nr:DUF6468 domain-containing protein [Aliidongia sp.]HEV2674079.1 DUF6468 domain-containing protein [Aliidongia sp.]
MLISLIMDAVVAGLLIATICFAVKLNGRLAALRRDSERLQGLIKDLQGASGIAEDAVAALRQTAGDVGRTLQGTIDGAKTLDADLRFITERADEVANRLEAGLRIQRDQQPTLSVGGPSPTQQAAAEASAKSNQSRLAMLLKQAEASEPSGRMEPTLDAPRTKGRAGAPARETAPRDVPRPSNPRPAETRDDTAPQSRAERDLLRALEARSRQ